ncbi:MAG: sigma-70 family RNA polymerase sigma factor [Succinivibrionaceae bacterium]
MSNSKEQNVLQYQKDCASAGMIEQGVAIIQKALSAFPICLKQLHENLQNSQTNTTTISYYIDDQPCNMSEKDLQNNLLQLLGDYTSHHISREDFTREFLRYRLSFDTLDQLVRLANSALHHGQAGSQQDFSAALEKGRNLISTGQDELINRHKALVMSLTNLRGKILNEYDREDLRQEGFLGLINATDRYNYRLGNCYMTFAYYRVRLNIDTSVAQLKNIRIPVNIMAKIARLAVREQKLTQKLSHVPTARELSEDLGISLEELEELQILKTFGTTSYDNKIKQRDYDEYFGDTLPDTRQKPAWEIINEEQTKEMIDLLMTELKPQQRTILELRFGFVTGDQLPRDEIGTILGISRERVRQIEVETLKKLIKKIGGLQPDDNQ